MAKNTEKFQNIKINLTTNNVNNDDESINKVLETNWKDRFIRDVVSGKINPSNLTRLNSIYNTLSSIEKISFIDSISKDISLIHNNDDENEIETLREEIQNLGYTLGANKAP